MGRHHENRDDLTGEHFIGDAGQMIGAVLFFTVWAADTFFFRSSTFLSTVIPLTIRVPVGIILGAASIYFARTGLAIVFGETRGKPEVIRKSVFSLVRHPVYFGEILAYLGFLLFSPSLAAAVVWLANIVFLNFIARHEESLLLKRFGEDYRAYMKEVPMWVPRLRRFLGKEGGT
jgi:protein-S-isoprenylcysteine O-methyltransferase Ste14